MKVGAWQQQAQRFLQATRRHLAGWWKAAFCPSGQPDWQRQHTLLEVERLESRELLTGNVRMIVVGGHLLLRGGAEAEEMTISAGSSAGEYVLAGLNGSTINGQTQVTVDNVHSLYANLRGGDDFLGIKDVQFEKSVRILAAQDNDDIQLAGIDVGKNVWAFLGGDADVVVDDAMIEGSLKIWGSSGNQSILIQNSQLAGRTNVATHKGDDRIGAFNNTFEDKAAFRLGKGAHDEAWFEGNTFNGKLTLLGGRGSNDEVTPDVEANNTVNGPSRVDGFEGNTELLDDVEWSYHGPTGPEFWPDLTPAYLLLRVGRSQSPIDIDTSSVTHQNLVDLVFNYNQAANQRFFHTSETVEIKFDEPAKAANSIVDSDGTVFNLVQFHFHTESDHTVDGQYFAGELHMVHSDANGNLLVLSTLLEEDDTATPNPDYLELLNNLPSLPSPAGDTLVTINPLNLLPASKQFYAYNGSLTTPPGSEDVRWRVLAEPVKLTSQQLQDLSDAIGVHDNIRPIQALNDREVVFDNV